VLWVAPSSFELPISRVPGNERERADARRNRERILCAAARLVAERGIDGISMDDVAHEAGVGKGTLYRRFGDRSSLLRALIEEPERDFQEALIRGEPPLGPGAPPIERLHAFGATLLQRLETEARFIREAEGLGAGRYLHPVYSFYRMHVGLLLRELPGDQTRTEYLVDCLLAPLAAEPFLFQRETLDMPLDQLIEGWCLLADAVAAAAAGARRAVQVQDLRGS
jgi:AcrR family transcriptional regulator